MLPISTWDSHHFDQLGSNALCEEQTLTFITAIIIVDDVYYHYDLRLLHTCICGAFGRPLGGAFVCIVAAAVQWHREGGVQPKMNTHACPRFLHHPALRID